MKYTDVGLNYCCARPNLDFEVTFENRKHTTHVTQKMAWYEIRNSWSASLRGRGGNGLLADNLVALGGVA